MEIKKMFLTPNKYSRPQTKIGKIRGIVIHWVANPNTSAKNNRDFWESRKAGTKGFGSAHYIIGLEGEIVQCLPETELAYHIGSHVYTQRALNELSSYPNNSTIGIEHCHTDWDGNMTKETYNASIQLTVDLLKRYNLTEKNLWLHYETNGWKDCHRLFVKNPDLWKKFKEDVAEALHGKTVKVEVVQPTKDDMVLIQPDETGLYVVKKGDTLWSIAMAFNITVKRLQELNPTVNPSALAIGTKVKVQGMKTFLIDKGDTLSEIARDYNTTVEKIMQLNPGINPNALQIGTTLIIDVEHNEPLVKEVIVKETIPVEVAKPVESKPKEVSSPLYPLPSKVLKLGSKGANVKLLQKALNALKFKVGTVDGEFGEKTQDAVKRFQSMFDGLEIDGVYGSDTQKVMEKELAKL